MTSKLKQISSSKCWGGLQNVYSHQSEQTKCEMKFGVYFPPGIDLAATSSSKRYPIVYFLSGLTCTEQNFIIKSGFQRYASELGLIVVNPDTSPRGCNIPGEEESWDFGTGAGFYVDAQTEHYVKHYRMHSYVTSELIQLVESEFEQFIRPEQRAITGHSMGGHGALISALRKPGLYKAVGAFAPISNPSDVPWGSKCLKGYLGEDKKEWENWDATKLVSKYNGPDLHLRIDQGAVDEFLESELLPQRFVDACLSAKVPVQYHLHEGYDHSYFFVGTFIEQQFKHLAHFLS